MSKQKLTPGAELAKGILNVLSTDKVFNTENINGSGIGAEHTGNLGKTYLNSESLTLSEGDNMYDKAKVFEDSFKNALDKLSVAMNGESINYDAALTIAKVGLNPKEFFDKASKGQQLDKDTVVIGTESITGMPFDSDYAGYSKYLEKLAMESGGTNLNLLSYDGGDPSKFLYSSIMLNATSNKQDDFADAFFPMIMMNPVDSYFIVESTVTNYIESYVHESAKVNKEMLKTKNILKHLNDNSLTKDNRFLVFPNVDLEANEKYLLGDFKYDRVFDGKIVNTAPYKVVDEEIDILGAAKLQTAGVPGAIADMTDSLDRSVALDALYIGKAGDGFKFDTRSLPTRSFVNTNQGDVKSISLNFNIKHTIALKDVVSAKTIENGKSGYKKSGTPLITLTGNIEDYVVKLKVSFSTSVTINTSVLNAPNGSVKLEGVYDRSSGKPVEITSGADYTNIVNYFADAKIIGFELKASRTNTNFRFGGLLLTNTAKKYAYNIPYRSGVQVKGPTVNPFGQDADILSIGVDKQAIMINSMMSVHAVQVVDKFAAYVRDAQLAGNDVIELCTPSAEYIMPYHEFAEWDAVDNVDSLTSLERSECIQKALLAKIRNIAINMMVNTNYKTVIDRVYNKVKPTVIIGTNEYIANYLTIDENKKFALTGFMDAMVVSSKNAILSGAENEYLGTAENPELLETKYKDLNGMIYLGLTIMEDANRNTAVHPMNYGFGVYSPSFSFDVVITRNGGQSRELQVNPRFDHIPNLPVVGVLAVKGIDKVIGKLPQLQKQVI